MIRLNTAIIWLCKASLRYLLNIFSEKNAAILRQGNNNILDQTCKLFRTWDEFIQQT